MRRADNMDDLILAALANPNGRYRGKTLLEYCFGKMDIRRTFCHFSKEDRADYFQLFHMLLEDGANAEGWLRRHTDEFVYLQKVTAECLRLLAVFLGREQTARALQGQSRISDFTGATAALTELLEREGFAASREALAPKGGDRKPGAFNPAALRTALQPENERERWEVGCHFEECMRGIHRLQTQPWLDDLTALLQSGADASMVLEGKVLTFFTIESLLETAADGVGLVAAVLPKGGAAVQENPALSGGLSQLQALCAACAGAAAGEWTKQM